MCSLCDIEVENDEMRGFDIPREQIESGRGKIAEQFEDEDGYWIVLNAGWRMPGDAHTICERTRTEARAKLKDAIRCDCDECKQIKAEAKSN